MAQLYTNENFPLPAVEVLRSLGRDVVTTQDAGRANLSVPDEDVLAFACNQRRILITLNRKHFIQLHQTKHEHSGIIVCTYDPDFVALAHRVHTVILNHAEMKGQLVRVSRLTK